MPRLGGFHVATTLCAYVEFAESENPTMFRGSPVLFWSFTLRERMNRSLVHFLFSGMNFWSEKVKRQWTTRIIIHILPPRTGSENKVIALSKYDEWWGPEFWSTSNLQTQTLFELGACVALFEINTFEILFAWACILLAFASQSGVSQHVSLNLARADVALRLRQRSSQEARAAGFCKRVRRLKLCNTYCDLYCLLTMVFDWSLSGI